MNAKLSIFIIAKNEGDRIGKTLAAVKGLGDEIIVIDSGSSDDTVAVSESYGAKVIFNEWPKGQTIQLFQFMKSPKANPIHKSYSI